MKEQKGYPVTVGEMVLALRAFARDDATDYQRLIMTEAAAELEKVQEARRRAERRRLYTPAPKKMVKVKRKTATRNPRYKPRLVMVQVEGEEPKVADLNEIMATPEDIDRMIQEAMDNEEKGASEIGECCICGYKAHLMAMSRLPDCNDCGKKRSCEYKPRPGALTRINCHLWEKEAEK